MRQRLWQWARFRKKASGLWLVLREPFTRPCWWREPASVSQRSVASWNARYVAAGFRLFAILGDMESGGLFMRSRAYLIMPIRQPVRFSLKAWSLLLSQSSLPDQ